MRESPLNTRLDRIEGKIDGLYDRLADHDHPEYWTSYRIVSTVVAIVGLAGGTLLAVLS